jgi:hypothetical protein
VVLVAYILAMTPALLFFVFLPTSYPRPPLPGEGTWHSTVYRLLVALDSPECCFPSGHIIIPALACWGVWQDGYRWVRWLLGADALCALTVLTTKQHYLWDLLGGLAAAGLGAALSRLLVRSGEGIAETRGCNPGCDA